MQVGGGSLAERVLLQITIGRWVWGGGCGVEGVGCGVE